MKAIETMTLRGRFTVKKYHPGDDPLKDVPFEVITGENLALTVGKNEILSLMTGASANHFDATNARIGVGDDATAPAATQTDLLATTNKTYKVMDANFPTTPSGGELTLQASFGPSDANYAWAEAVIKQNTSGKVLNRSTNSGTGWGTKATGSTWVMVATFGLNG